jgi:hypothetical protein
MAQYQQDPALINPPRYTGQSAGTELQGADGRGPLQESRYGATPVSTGVGNNQNNGLRNNGGQFQQQSTSPVDAIHDPAAYGFQNNQQQSQPETGFKVPGMSGGNPQQGLGQGSSQMVDPNTSPSQAGYGNSQPGYGQSGMNDKKFDQPSRVQGTQMAGSNVDPSQAGYGNSQPGYGQSGMNDRTFDQPSRMQGTQMAGSNVDPSQAGYGDSQGGYGQTGARDRMFQQQPGEQGLGNQMPSNTMPSQAGSYGSSQNGYGQNRTPAAAGDLAFSQQQPSSGQPGFGAPTQGMNTTNLWPTPAAPPGAHRTDQMVGDGGNQSQQQYSPGYGASNMNMGANRNGEQYGTDGAPGQAGGMNQQGLGSELPGAHPHHRSAAGVDTTQGALGTTNMNHPSVDTGFGGGVGNTSSAANSIPLGEGEHRVEPGYDGSAGNLQNLSSKLFLYHPLPLLVT